jgi:hypothetical protein
LKDCDQKASIHTDEYAAMCPCGLQTEKVRQYNISTLGAREKEGDMPVSDWRAIV